MNPNSSPLFADPSARILSVSELNRSVANVLERNFPLLWVAGEVSNLTRAASGHWYFTLKDAQGCARAVMFRSRAAAVDFTLTEGMHVEVRALVTLYAARGDYQLNVEAMRRAGMGRLYEAFVRLRDQLAQEGLFDAERKRPLPRFARRVGIVTSRGAAALRDVLSALHRRAPHVEVVLYPSPVQGADAPAALIAALDAAHRRAEVDVLILCRGGGSIEDLWAFNDEALARKLVSMPMPVVAGIGHETDFTIADFAADVRAATPTAAAELVCTPRADLQAALESNRSRLRRAMAARCEAAAQRLDRATAGLAAPATQLERARLRVQSLGRRLADALRLRCVRSRRSLDARSLDLRAARMQTARAGRRIEAARDALRAAWAARLLRNAHQLERLAAGLEAMDPLRVVARGYSVVTDESGHVITSADALRAGMPLRIRLARGAAQAVVSAVEPGSESKE
jgi:exodeoxyribonuclease VII large subunit